MRHPIRFATLAVFGVVLGLVATEVCLQTAAALRRIVAPARDVQRPGASQRILCVGDSNTYGVYLDAAAAYPSQLEHRLGGDVQVVNLGYPGMNSSRLRTQFRRMLMATHPQVVLVLVGANDFWTVPANDAEFTASAWLWEHSRVFRMLYMLVRGSSMLLTRLPDNEVIRTGSPTTIGYGAETLELGWEAAPQHDWKRHYPENIAAIRGMAEGYGAELVLLTYPSEKGVYATTSRVIRDTAATLGLPLIDLGRYFHDLCRSQSCADLFVFDGHPTEAGYGRVADVIAASLGEHEAAIASP